MKRALVPVVVFAAAVALVLVGATIQGVVTGENPFAADPQRKKAPWILDEGDCFDDGPEWSRDTRVTVLDCAGSHDSEVVAVESFRTFGDDETPEDITAEAEDECAEGFAAYADSLPADSGVVLRVYHPSSPRYPVKNPFGEREWDLACVAWSADGRFGRS